MNETRLNNNRIVQNNNPLLAEKIQECPECGSKNIIIDPEHGEICCGDCGAVIAENMIDLGPEWRAFNKEQKARRERTSPTDPYRTDDGLGTLYRDIPGVKSRVGRTKLSNEKTLMTAYGEVNRICSALGLSKEIEHEAIELSKKTQKKKLFVGRGGIHKSVAAIILIICRVNNIPIGIKEITSVTFFPQKEILAKLKTIKKRFGIQATVNMDPCAFLPKFCSKLGLNMQAENLAREIIGIANEQNLFNGERPNGIAGAAIYIAALANGNERKIQRISIMSNITEPTINKRIDEFINNKKIFGYLLSLDKI